MRLSTRLGPLLLGLLLGSVATAQELTPRTYWPAPKGTNSAVFGAFFSRGDFAQERGFPVQVEGLTVQGLQASYYRSFGLAGRTASLTLTVPWIDLSADGTVEGTIRARDTGGLGDAWARLSVNLVGAPAMAPGEFQGFRQDPKNLVGLSLRIKAPTGQYDPDRLINVGSNRWAFKPELGLVFPFRRHWVIEGSIGAWLFATNEDYFGGNRLTQDNLASSEIHLVYRVRPGFWVSLDWNAFSGGRTAVNGEQLPNSQQNSRAGLTLSIPFRRVNAFRIGFSTPLTTDYGGDYNSFVIGLQHAWR